MPTEYRKDAILPADRDKWLKEMELSLSFADKIFRLIDDAYSRLGEGGVFMLDSDEIGEKAVEHFGFPLVDERKASLAIDLQNCIQEAGVGTCGLWHYAHFVQHSVYDVDHPLR